MKKLIIVIFIGSFLSCSDEIQVNAPYKDTTVVYGLLSKSDSRHYIKINKAFLGEGDANQMALIADSSEYENLEAKILKKDGENIVSETLLQDTLITNKQTGDFFAPNQTIYYFDDQLDENYEYELQVNVQGKQELVRAQTPVIDDFNLTGGQIFGNAVVPVSFINSGGVYSTQLFTYTSVPSAKSYQLIMHVHYTNHYLDETTEEKSFDVEYSNQTTFSTNGGQAMQQEISGEAFYQTIASRIAKKAATPNLSHRKFDFITFSMIAAGDELSTYLEVNSPSTGVIQEKPQYTNIENGIGIFSTRVTVRSQIEKALNNNSLVELYTGQYTSEHGFCANQGVNACP